MSKKQVFVLEIMGQQEYTWQGRVQWIGGKKESSFRSVMELLHLISSVLDDEDEELQEARKLFENAGREVEQNEDESVRDIFPEK